MAKSDYIVVGGGCFWGMEQLLAQQPGVIASRVGYCGGHTDQPSYQEVCTGRTGHAEALKLVFDPEQSSLHEILHFFFRIHDPTQLNRQGHDHGSQYRSVIFYRNDQQKSIARQVMAEVAASGRWSQPLVTSLEPEGEFFEAEEYHQKYLEKNPGGYSCHYIRD